MTEIGTDQEDVGGDILGFYIYIVEMMFLVDIILPFFREYKTDEGIVVRKLEMIAKRYIQSDDF